MAKPPVKLALEICGIEKQKERNKWQCPGCSSHSGFHDYGDRYYCFGCGIRGDAMDLYQLCTGVGFREACEALGASGIIRSGGIKRIPIVRKKPKTKKGLATMDRGKLQELWDGLPVITREPTTAPGKELTEYLVSHGIEKQADHFGLPFRLIPDSQWFYDRVIRCFGDVPKFMINNSGRFFLYSHAVCWGYRDNDGINQMRFRIFAGRTKALQFTGVQPILYDVSDIPYSISDVTCICEGEPDAIACACAGMRAVGVAGASQSIDANGWHKLFVPIKRAVVCVQGDRASAEWHKKVKESLDEAHIKHTVYTAPEGWDIADMMAKDADRACEAILETTWGEEKC